MKDWNIKKTVLVAEEIKEILPLDICMTCIEITSQKYGGFWVLLSNFIKCYS